MQKKVFKLWLLFPNILLQYNSQELAGRFTVIWTEVLLIHHTHHILLLWENKHALSYPYSAHLSSHIDLSNVQMKWYLRKKYAVLTPISLLHLIACKGAEYNV